MLLQICTRMQSEILCFKDIILYQIVFKNFIITVVYTDFI